MRNPVFLGVILLLAACGSSDQKTKNAYQPAGPLAKTANSDLFNTSFGNIMRDYYLLKDGFVEEKETVVAASARELIISIDSLKLTELKADSNLVSTAGTYALGMVSELKGLLGEKDWEGKRKSFQIVSDQLYDLIRTVQYNREVVYHNYCSMAFNDQGANWLSNTPVIRNPYSPKKMIHCGEIKDSIDFRSK